LSTFHIHVIWVTCTIASENNVFCCVKAKGKAGIYDWIYENHAIKNIPCSDIIFDFMTPTGLKITPRDEKSIHVSVYKQKDWHSF